MLFREPAGPALKINGLGNVRKWEGNFERYGRLYDNFKS